MNTGLSHNWLLNGLIEVNCPIFQREHLFERHDGELATHGSLSVRNRRLVVVDRTVMNIYSSRIERYFSTFCDEFRVVAYSTGESTKNLDLVLSIIDDMNGFSLVRRSEPIIVIGGGVLLDAAGMAAGLYRRGTPYIRVPTTLIGQIDAGIGIKTGVNHQGHKNRLGSYFSPIATFIDRSFLASLDERHIGNGISEIIKIAIVKNRELFETLVGSARDVVKDRLVGRTDYDRIYDWAIEGMLEELRPNLLEMDLQRSVDYGHTFSPAIEMAARPPLLHGEAVAVDMSISMALSLGRNLVSQEEYSRALQLMVSVGLPVTHELARVEFLWPALLEAASHRDGWQRTPLARGIGEVVFVNDITYDELSAAASRVRAFAEGPESHDQQTMKCGLL